MLASMINKSKRNSNIILMLFCIIVISFLFQISNYYVFQELLEVMRVMNNQEKSYDIQYFYCMLMMSVFVSFLVGSAYQKIKNISPISIPNKNCLPIAVLSTLLMMVLPYFSGKYHNYLYSYSTVSGIPLLVALFSVFYTRVSNPDMKLGKKQIITGISILVGCLLFYKLNQYIFETSFLLYFLLFVYWVSCGLQYDLFAEVKEKYSPSAIDLMVQINKGTAIFMFIFLVLSWQIFDFLVILSQSPIFILIVFGHSLLLTLTQLVEFKMIIHFRQHVFPLFQTAYYPSYYFLKSYTYKAFDVWQIIGLILVLSVTVFQLISEIKHLEKIEKKKNNFQKDEHHEKMQQAGIQNFLRQDGMNRQIILPSSSQLTTKTEQAIDNNQDFRDY